MGTEDPGRSGNEQRDLIGYTLMTRHMTTIMLQFARPFALLMF
jgi:hypothetical protein